MFGPEEFFLSLIFFIYITVVIILIKNIAHKSPSPPPPPPPPPPNKVIQGTLNSKLFGDIFHRIPTVTSEEFLKLDVDKPGVEIPSLKDLNIYKDTVVLATIDLSPGKYLISYNLLFSRNPYGPPTTPTKYPDFTKTNGPWSYLNIISSKNSENNKCILSEISYGSNDSEEGFIEYNNSVLYEATEQERIRINFLMLNTGFTSPIMTGPTYRDIVWAIQSYGSTDKDTSLLTTIKKSCFLRALKLS